MRDLLSNIKSCIERFLLSVLQFTSTKQLKPTTKLQNLNLKNSGILEKKEFGTGLYYRQIDEYEKMWNLGHYEKAIKIREEFLQEIYDNSGNNYVEYYPPFYPQSFSSNIGHLPFFILHNNLIKNLTLPSGDRYLLRTTKKRFQEFFTAIELLYTKEIGMTSDSTLDQIPSLQFLFERLDTFKTKNGFEDIYSLTENLFASKCVSQSNSLVNFQDEFQDTQKKKLQALGLNDFSKFITIHVRKKSHTYDMRGANLEDFKKTIDYLLDQQFTIVQIGDGSSQVIPRHRDIIDLTKFNDFGIQLYSLSKAKFHVGTQSGPSTLAHFLGTPVMQSNTTAIGRNLFTASEFSIYLPKKVQYKNRELSLFEILSQPVAYAETLGLRKYRYFLRDNSSDEILDAVKDMINLQENKMSKKQLQAFNRPVGVIQEKLKSVGKGNLAPSFIEKNYDWLKIS